MVVLGDICKLDLQFVCYCGVHSVCVCVDHIVWCCVGVCEGADNVRAFIIYIILLPHHNFSDLTVLATADVMKNTLANSAWHAAEASTEKSSGNIS